MIAVVIPLVNLERAAAKPHSICVIVLAHNEEERIAACLDSLPRGMADGEIHVVVNGSRDRTAEIASGFAGVTVHDWQQGGKARSWNRIMLDTPGIDAGAYVFVDGDARILPGSIEALARAVSQPGINAAAGLPANGRRAPQYRRSIIAQHGMFGDLYALSGEFVERMRNARIRLPEDVIGDDSLIGAMAKTDLACETNWRDDRVATCQDAQFLCDPVRLSVPSLQLQARRMKNYSLRHFQNAMIRTIMRSTGPVGLPDRLDSLYSAYLPRFTPRRDPRYWLFDYQALAQMRAAAAASPTIL